MLKIAFILFFMLSSIPLTRFQFLLLMCYLEVETGILFGDYYTLTLFSGYFLFRWLWFKALNAPVSQFG